MKKKTKILMTFCVITLSIVIAFSILLYMRVTQMAEDSAEDTIAGLLEQTAISVDNVMLRVEDLCFRMYTNQSLRNIFQTEMTEYSYWQQMEDYYTLMNIYNANMADKYIEGIRFYFKVHGVYEDIQYACYSMEEAALMPWYAAAAGTEGAHWVGYEEAYKKSGESGYTISCIREVSRAGESCGYIEVRLNQNIILEILRNMRDSVDGNIYILTRNGRVLLSSETGSSGLSFDYDGFLEGIQEEGKEIRTIQTSDGDEKRLISTWKGKFLFVVVIPEEMFRTRAAEFMPFVFLLAVLELILVVAVSRKAIMEVYEAKLKKQEAELLLLQAQINPHFLYNTLDSINWMANKRKAYDISKMTRLLADFFRQSLNKGENIILLRDEFAHAQTYLKMIQMRYEEEITVSYDLEEEVLSQKIINFILQPIVENAVIHGLMEREEAGGLLKLSAVRKGENTVISIADNGVGIPKEKLKLLLAAERKTEGRGGYGLRNVNERIQLHYGQGYGLKIYSEEGCGTTVEVWLPYRPEKTAEG